MKKHGTYLVPTLLAGDWVTQKAKVPGFFPPVVARKAATIQNLGAIKPGYYADLVVVKANPLKDITALQHVQSVFKNGKQEK